jgi:hypothetical protein
MAAPSFSKVSGAGVMTAATRQLVDDLALARIKAITERTTVYVVFLDSGLVTFPTGGLNAAQQIRYSDLLGGQFTDYALFVGRSVGDQPGRNTGRYLTEWKGLPDGVFIAQRKFTDPANSPNAYTRGFRTDRPFPFPDETSLSSYNLPYLAFDPNGQLVPSGAGGDLDEIISLARGSIFIPRDVNGDFAVAAANVIETPPGNSTTNYNRIRINWLTGRTRVERPEL